ncbi:CHAT domain-containing protein [Candidatus Venteria ishoeyi]|uniref:CHAT domain protein n=1 Tax=Candidatus Venteria ishoeyi TaxID=1899563 RepID=A0A1H6FFF0_9GAMM|nr:CHAT domain-containing protein [Candidatus Venteria ishoeyi]SEH08141.1 CHAT domain protein [Candidatus Venteria ishoeyi]
MHIQITKLHLLLLYSLSISCAVTFAAPPDSRLQQADALFNQQQYAKAQDLYLKLYSEWKSQTPRPLHFSELVNNIAACSMVQGKTKLFRKSFSLAKQLKQALPHTKPTKISNNLLQNGDFEDGLLFPWGTGHYEREDGKFDFGLWWNSKNAQAFMKIDTAEFRSGQRALQIGNASPNAPHVFSTLSQRISGLQPNQVYHIEYDAKARDLKPGAISFAVDPGWNKRLPAPPPGTYGWQHFQADINIGHNDLIDFRILSLNSGFFWIDNIHISKAENKKNSIQQAERLYDSGQYQKALDIYQRLQQQTDSKRQQAYLGWQAGRAQMALGDYPAALAAFEAALQHKYLHAHIDLGQWAMQLGDYSRAETHLQAAAKHVAGDQNTLSLVLNQLSRCYLAQDKADLALNSQRRAYHILKHIDNPHGQALALNQLGRIYLAKADFAAAQEPFEHAKKLAQQLDDPLLSQRSLLNLAWLAYLQQQPTQAQQWLNQALPLAKSLQDRVGEIRALRLQSLLLRDSHPAAAILFGKQAVNNLQKLRSDLSVLEQSLQQQFIKDKAKTYEELADLLIQQGRLNEAQQVLAMLKEEEYFDFVRRDTKIQNLWQHLNYNSQEQAWNQSYASINVQLVAIGKKLRMLRKKAHAQTLTATEQQQRQQLSLELEAVLQAFQQWLDAIQDAESLSVDAGEKITLGEDNQRHLQQLQQNLHTLDKAGQGVALLHYLITEQQLHILLTTARQQQVRSVPISAQKLHQLIANLRAALRDPRNRSYRSRGNNLYQQLITPIAPALEQAKVHTLMLSLDGALRYVPLAALYDGKQFLLERYALVNYTEAAKQHITTPPLQQWLLAGLGLTQAIEGFAPLPAVAKELESIIVQNPQDKDGVLNGVIYLNDDFNAGQFQGVLGKDYPVLHIASHFVFSPGTEKDSYLLLGDGRHLDLGEIRQHYAFAGVDLLTLSACQTAVGSIGQGSGREIEGFGALAQKNGAKSVIASLWSVDDRSTGLLMQKLYENHHQGDNKAEALRRAQLGFIQPQTNSTYPVYYRHPYYWAAFILMGNWL